MVEAIVWTAEADLTYENIIDYLLTSFSEKEVTKFSGVVQKKINLIQSNPNIYRRSQKFPNVHYTIILKRVLLVRKTRS